MTSKESRRAARVAKVKAKVRIRASRGAPIGIGVLGAVGISAIRIGAPQVALKVHMTAGDMGVEVVM